MELVQVKIKGTVVTSRYGTLASGDVLRTDAAFAKHLVEECQAGEYVQGEAAAAPTAAQSKKDKKAAKAKAELQAAIVDLEAAIAAAEDADKPLLAEQLAAKQQELAALTE